jgi:hypothetical protein
VNKLLIIFSVSIASCSNFKTNDSNQNNRMIIRSKDSTAAVLMVTNFFKAFDDKDVKKIALLLPAKMKIVHHNGAETNTGEMIKVIEGTKNWWPRTRNLSNYEFISDGNISILGLTNEVTFSLPDNQKVYEPYKETWIFETMDGTLSPIRCHYSKVTVEKHSEEVH